MRIESRSQSLREVWWRFAVAVTAAALIVSVQGCCCCSKTCVDQIGTIVQEECRKACETDVIVGAFVFDEQDYSTSPDCIGVNEPTTINASAGAKIQFVNKSSVPLSLKSSIPNIFVIDDWFDLDPGESRILGIREDASLSSGATFGINLNVDPSGTKCPGIYPGPSIEWD